MSNKNKHRSQLELFGNSIQPIKEVVCNKDAIQDQLEKESAKVISLDSFQKDQLINKFYEEVKRLTQHLD